MRKTVSIICLAALAALQFGCGSTQTPQSTAQDKKDFMGGPMPPDVAKKLAEEQKNAHPSAPGQGGPPPGATGPGSGAPK